MTLPVVKFMSQHDVTALEAKLGSQPALGVGMFSPFANKPVSMVRQIENIEGCSAYDIWFGMTRIVGKNLQSQLQAGSEIIVWVAKQIEEKGLDPYGEILVAKLPAQFKEYVQAAREVRRKMQPSLDRADVYVVNDLYHVAVNVSENPGILSAQYGLLPFNEIEFSMVYNPGWGRMSIGANTVHSMPHPSLAMQVFQNLSYAREWYQQQQDLHQQLIITTRLNLDVVTAIMLMSGYDLPEVWVEYVQSLKFGNFEGRPNRPLPDLNPVAVELTKLEESGTWGGPKSFIGSPFNKRTSVTSLEQVLEVLSQKLPILPGLAPSVRLLVKGKK